MDLTIEGKAFVNGVFQDCCIGVKDREIVAIKKALKANTHYRFNRRVILPAGVDIHVHFREPGLTHKEDFATGSKAAVFGGISCVFDMPNTVPPTTTIQALAEKTTLASKKAFIDFGLYAGITNNNIDNIAELEKTCSGFKIYLGSTTHSLLLDSNNLDAVLARTSSNGKPILVHAEDNTCLNKHKQTEHSLVEHHQARPSKCEEQAIAHILKLVQKYNSKLHICHLSSCEGFELLKSHKNNLTIGVTPHHVLFHCKDKMKHETYYKVNPPLRSGLDREILFNAVKNGMIHVLESDHAPHTLDEKDTDFHAAPSGIPGVETMLPLFLYMAQKEMISFKRLITLVCEKPAELLGVPKGKIEVGRDADFQVVDLKNACKINVDKLHSKCRWSPFEGWPAIFPEYVFVRGEKLIDRYELQGRQGYGRFTGA